MIDEQTLRLMRTMSGSSAAPALADRISISKQGESTPYYIGAARFTASGAQDIKQSVSMQLQQQSYAQVEIPNGALGEDSVKAGDNVEVLASVEPALVGRYVAVRHSAPVSTWAATIKFNVLLT